MYKDDDDEYSDLFGSPSAKPKSTNIAPLAASSLFDDD